MTDNNLYSSILNKISSVAPFFAKSILDKAIKKRNEIPETVSAIELLDILKNDINPTLSKYGSVIDSVLISQAGIIFTNIENNITHISPVAQSLLKGLREIYNESAKDISDFEILKIIKFTKTVDEFYEIDIQEIYLNETNQYFNVSNFPNYNDQGQVIDNITIFQENTLQMEIEKEVLVQNRMLINEIELRKAKEFEIKILNSRLSQIKDCLDVAALVSETDLEGIITYANDKFCEVSKYTLGELIGSTHSMINSGKHSNKFWMDVWKTIKRGCIWKGEVCNMAKDGSLYWVEATIMPLRDDMDRIIGYSSIRIDITKKKEIEGQLLHRSKLASLGELSAGVGHEINNPLAIAVGNTSQLRKLIHKPTVNIKEVLQHLKKQDSAHDRIKAIVDGLRIYARVDSEDTSVISINDTVAETLGFISEIYQKEGVELSIDMPEEHLFINVSEGKFQQVLMNLLANAKDALLHSIHKKISLRLKKINSENVSIEVEDNGIGIDKNNLVKIFNPFFTTKQIGEGTGIGLGLVSELVKEMNGRITVDSTVGKGSIFRIVLDTVSHRPLELPKELVANDKGLLKGTALVIDDEEGIREILVDYLEEIGLIVEESDCGLSALEKLKKKDYDFICTDMKMPQMNGDEFIYKAKKMDNTKKSKFIMISGGVSEDYSSNAESLEGSHFDGCVTKPFTNESIYNVLKSCQH